MRGFDTAGLGAGRLLNLSFPVVRARIVPASIFLRGHLQSEDEGAEEPPNQTLAARIVALYHESYATKRFGEAHTVELPDDQLMEAHEATRHLIADPRTHAIVRPAFFWKKPDDANDVGIGVRAGALVRRSDKNHFTLTDLRATRSVFRSSSSLRAGGEVQWKREPNRAYILDLALKVYVARAAGIPINKAGIVHLSGDRVFEGNVDPASFFEFVDLTEEVDALGDGIVERIMELQARHHLLRSQPRALPRGPEADSPSDLSKLYILSERVRTELEGLGITDIGEIPDGFNAGHPDCPLTPIQLRQVAAIKQNRLVVEDADSLREALQGLMRMFEGGRLSFFDLETIAPPVALIKGGKNGETITLQFSNHYVEADGNLQHDELLYDENPLEDGALGRWDQRLTEAILQSVGPAGPILVYNASFEKSRIREVIRRLRKDGEEKMARRLEGLLPDGALRVLADRLEARGLTHFAGQLRKVIGNDGLVRKYVENLRTARGREPNKKQPSKAALRLAEEIEEAMKTDRFVDLLPLVRNHLYHPAFNGSFSLKDVLKGLCEGKGYGDLQEIWNGELATTALEEMLDPATAEPRKIEIQERLLAYCGRDTLAEVWVLEQLFRVAGLDVPYRS